MIKNASVFGKLIYNDRVFDKIANYDESVHGKMQHPYQPQVPLLIQVLEELQVNQTSDNEDLERLKGIIRVGLSTYIHNTATDRNLFFKDRAASQPRAEKMLAILRLVKDANDVGQLTSAIKKEAASITHTGLFNRSELRDEMLNAVAIHKDLRP